MKNLFYLAHKKGVCPVCGGHTYLNAIYLEDSATGWHVMIEQQCQDCSGVETTNLPLGIIQEMISDLTAPREDAPRARGAWCRPGTTSGDKDR